MRILEKIFETATRPFELFNGLIFLGYAFVFYKDGHILYSQHIYARFQDIPLSLTVGVFAVLGALQLLLALRDGYNSNIISGYITLQCGVVWLFVYAAFAAPYPPLNTNMVFSFMMSVACMLCGKRLIDMNKMWKHHVETKAE